MTHLFYYPDGTPMSGVLTPSSDNANITLWNPNNGEPKNFTVSIRNESLTEDHPGGAWWNSAMTQGFQQMGVYTGGLFGIYPNGTLWPDQGSSAIALAMMTGYSVTVTEISDYSDISAFFHDLSIVNEGQTPMVLSTNGVVNKTNPTITPDHDYSVLKTEGTDSVRVRNPWGADDVFQVEDLWRNCFSLTHLTNWNRMEWEEVGQGTISEEQGSGEVSVGSERR
jgi:hypothetical protein